MRLLLRPSTRAYRGLLDFAFGSPCLVVGVNTLDQIRFGIDLGRTKIEMLALDESGKELLRQRIATPLNDYLATVKAIAGLVYAAEKSLAARASVGIATPGAVSRLTGRIKYEERLARALASVINVIDPEFIVLGGGLSNISRWYQSVPQLWGRHVFSDHVATRLLPPKFGDSSGVRGAAWLWSR